MKGNQLTHLFHYAWSQNSLTVMEIQHFHIKGKVPGSTVKKKKIHRTQYVRYNFLNFNLE